MWSGGVDLSLRSHWPKRRADLSHRRQPLDAAARASERLRCGEGGVRGVARGSVLTGERGCAPRGGDVLGWLSGSWDAHPVLSRWWLGKAHTPVRRQHAPDGGLEHAVRAHWRSSETRCRTEGLGSSVRSSVVFSKFLKGS